MSQQTDVVQLVLRSNCHRWLRADIPVEVDFDVLARMAIEAMRVAFSDLEIRQAVTFDEMVISHQDRNQMFVASGRRMLNSLIQEALK